MEISILIDLVILVQLSLLPSPSKRIQTRCQRISFTSFVVPDITDADANAVMGTPFGEVDVVADLIGSTIPLVLVACAAVGVIVFAEAVSQERDLGRIQIVECVHQIKLVSSEKHRRKDTENRLHNAKTCLKAFFVNFNRSEILLIAKKQP
jgi:hypothetical protein